MNDEQFNDASSLDLMDDDELTGLEFEENSLESEPTIPVEGNNVRDDDSSSIPASLKGDEDSDDLDFTAEVLRLKGISDPNKIKFEDESGAIVEKSWDSLTRREQLNILTQEGNPETDLVDSEIELINAIRQSQLSPAEYLAALQQQAMAYVQNLQTPVYAIDDLDDDELFALDLISKVGEENITDEEIQDTINNAKQNSSLYEKQIEALRNLYKALEDERHIAELLEALAIQELNFLDFAESILNEIEGFNLFSGQPVELSTLDKNDLANFILTRDENGVSDFGRVMNNPQTFTMAAFWTLKGPEIMAEMLELIQEAYKRGFSDGGRGSKPTNRVTIQKSTPSSKQSYQGTFDHEDESYLYQ